jgi:hypothetical protein
MPQVIYGKTNATLAKYSVELWFTTGRCNAICLDVMNADDNKRVNPEMVKGFRVMYVNSRKNNEVESFYIDADVVNSSVVSKYQPKPVMSWSLTRHIRDCFIIPVIQEGNVTSDKVYVEVYLQKPMNTYTNLFYLHDYEHIYFTETDNF